MQIIWQLQESALRERLAREYWFQLTYFSFEVYDKAWQHIQSKRRHWLLEQHDLPSAPGLSNCESFQQQQLAHIKSRAVPKPEKSDMVDKRYNGYVFSEVLLAFKAPRKPEQHASEWYRRVWWRISIYLFNVCAEELCGEGGAGHQGLGAYDTKDIGQFEYLWKTTSHNRWADQPVRRMQWWAVLRNRMEDSGIDEEAADTGQDIRNQW